MQHEAAHANGWARIIGKDLPIPPFCFLAAREDLRASVDHPLTAENNKTNGPDKMFVFDKC